MREFVLDCSIAIAWFLPDESNDYALSIKQAFEKQLTAHVPAIWLYEISNVLYTSIKRKRTTLPKAKNFQELLLDTLPIEIDCTKLPEKTKKCLELSNTLQITSYDAAYLELACRKNLPIATLDKELRKASEKLGVELFNSEKIL